MAACVPGKPVEEEIKNMVRQKSLGLPPMKILASPKALEAIRDASDVYMYLKAVVLIRENSPLWN